jgi:hypothetical protein
VASKVAKQNTGLSVPIIRNLYCLKMEMVSYVLIPLFHLHHLYFIMHQGDWNMKKFCSSEIDHDNISDDTNPLFEKGLYRHVNKRIETWKKKAYATTIHKPNEIQLFKPNEIQLLKHRMHGLSSKPSL